MILHEVHAGIRSKSSEHGSKMKMSSAPPSDRRRLRRAAVPAVGCRPRLGVGRDADDIPERFGELAAVIVPKLAGSNMQHRAVGPPQEPGSAMHFLRAQDTPPSDMPYTPRKLLLMSVAEGAEAQRELRDQSAAAPVFSSRSCADLLGELHLRLRIAVLRLGRLHGERAQKQQQLQDLEL